MLGVYRFYHPSQIYLVGLPSGTTVALFYVTYNTLYFENTPKDKRAFSSSFFTLAGPFLGILIPPIVGFCGQKWGFPSIFLIAILVLLITLYLTKFLPKIEFESNLGQILKKTRQINFLLVIEGIKETVGLVAIPLFTLFFIQKPLRYGVFFSYLAFISTAATVLLGYLSDKFKKRVVILYPVTSLVAITIILLGFSQSFTWWAIITGILGFILTINGTFVTTLVLDKVSQVKEGMISREFLLGIGRTIGTFIILGSFIFYQSFKPALISIGSLYFIFPLTVYLRKIYHQTS
jgi:MFS family permease